MVGGGGWMDGFLPDDDDLIDSPEPEPVAPPATTADPRILLCKHCKSERLHLKKTSSDSISNSFHCVACGGRTTFKLPYGYSRVYLANPEQP